MATGLNMRPTVLAAKDYLATSRERLRRQHDAGALGVQICAQVTDVFDKIVLDLYEAALSELPADAVAQCRSDVALVAHGGYGRRDVAPYSDVDLMILHRPAVAKIVTPLARRMMHDLYDAGLALGQSVRTISDACAMARKDATIFTSLAESRLLAGSTSLFEKYSRRLHRSAKLRWRSLVGTIDAARHEERVQYGETVYLLEPNVKRSRGGLRDIQLLRWIGFARYGRSSPESLEMLGVLSRDDQRALRAATEFLLRLRNELHFHAGKSHDVLNRSEQLRIAALLGFRGSEGLLPVEQFMSQYFRHSDQVSHTVSRFAINARPWRRLTELFGPLVSHQVEGDFRVGPKQISATRRGMAKLHGDLSEVLRLANLANSYNKSVSPDIWEAVHHSRSKLPDVLSAAAAERFIEVLSQPARLGELLRGLLECGVLERVIPDFTHARSLLQFNEYHKYTVDEHCIRAVERATALMNDPSELGNVYRSIKQKHLLHLALLIHDLGKGFAEDHSELGEKIAERTARRLRLPPRDADTVKFLVHKHLTMAHLTFRRDTSDEQLIVRFAVEVGSPDVLTMLYVLTASDLAAVGPGVLNDWKIEVLTDLYHRTMQHLAGDTLEVNSQERRSELRARLADESDPTWYRQHIEALPGAYLFSAPPEKIAAELKQLHSLPRGGIASWANYLPENQTTEYTIGSHEGLTHGIFHKLTGALSSQGLQILAADINTLPDGLVLDRFVVHDPDFSGPPTPERLDDVRARLNEALSSDHAPTFRRTWQSDQKKTQAALMAGPTVVTVDNTTSDRYTIIDVFTSDRMGLLYTITRTLFDLGLSVSIAKISTHLDQVVDVFYVTDQQGAKITDDGWLQHIRATLLEAIEAAQKG